MKLFAIRDYRHLFGAQIIALFGTGLATIALGLLAYELAGPRAGAVLATALTIKMVMYVVIAPLTGAYADRLPRRALLTVLDCVRAGVVLVLPFVTEIWQIYLLVGVLQAASAAFTPTFQAVIPDIVTDEAQYTRALSASQVASTMESLLSPVLAAVALTFMTFNWLFVGTSVGFLVSAGLVLSTRIPNATASGQTRVWDRISAGIRTFFATPRLRGVLALNMAVAATGSIVVVNTVNYVRDVLGGSQADVAWMLAASGSGTLLVALTLPKVLDRIADRGVMLTGAAVLVVGVLAALVMALAEVARWIVTVPIWVLIGAGMAMIITPTGRVIRASVSTPALPGAFAAQFSLSHLAWLISYPIAGWIGTAAGLGWAWGILGILALSGAIAAPLLWRPESPAPEAIPPASTEPEPDAAEGTLVAGQCACTRPL
ncbi:putative MFS family arabinose efflux permease [Propionibacteriaceae bacterium ES.041]|uniref:MFS transporter n=1 Tax=Enemella evansiae TaxID=2016499 RepID=UPI000B9767CA|nr:MFS transporter [Enemella evansiae]OYN94655.1 MFS transporter [Enemella evansiae]PFG67727.1 putative MFS family arabinose efflux permease [Propionibacteriaceae bacterium ES.041]